MIVWTCHVCQQPAENGVLYISYRELRHHETAAHAWREKHPGAATVQQLSEHPGKVLWKVAHPACVEDPTFSDAYWIDVERVSTCAELLLLSAHLLEKTWLPNTNWDVVCRDTATKLLKA